MGCACSVDLGHAAKVIVLRLGSMVFDVISDVGNGVYQYNPKTVTRNLTLFGNFTAPENCVPDNDNNTSGMFNCQEEDIEWAALTFLFIQFPALVLAIFMVLTILAKCFKEGFRVDQVKELLLVVLIVLLPFPILIFGQQVTSIFSTSAHMEWLSTLFLFGEGSLEAPPQLLLMMYIIFSDSERKVATIQWVSVVSSVATISKTTIKLYLADSYSAPDGNIFSQEAFDRDSPQDSMLRGRGLLQRIKMIVQFSPAFLTSLIFKVGSIAIISTFLKRYVMIYICLGTILTIIVAFYYFNNNREHERLSTAIMCGICNITILVKTTLGSRKENYRTMMAVSLAWLIFHTVTILMLMVWFGAMDPSTHLAHWKQPRFFFYNNMALFYTATSGIIVFGPISIFSLWALKRQVKAFAAGENQLQCFWGK